MRLGYRAPPAERRELRWCCGSGADQTGDLSNGAPPVFTAIVTKAIVTMTMQVYAMSGIGCASFLH
jgi:hypothetical protein